MLHFKCFLQLIRSVVFLIHVFQGHVSGAMLPLVGAALAGTAVGTAVGMFLFRRLTMTGIKKVVYYFYDVCRKLSPFILNLFAETIGRLHIVLMIICLLILSKER